MHKIALQTISWGDPQHHIFDHIFTVAVGAGFDGVEIGFRRLGKISIAEACSLFDKHQLKLSACHVGGNLSDLTQAANEREALDTVLDYISALNSQFLIYSGLNIDNTEALARDIERLRSIAQGCSDRGVTLLYHNHDWEFRDDRRIWNQLQEARIDDLGYALDLGWAVKGGQDIKTLLDEIGDVTQVLHFKDFYSWQDGQNTCHLGEGVVDFTPAWDWVSHLSEQKLWLTAEQDNAIDSEAACELNSAYMAAQLMKKES